MVYNSKIRLLHEYSGQCGTRSSQNIGYPSGKIDKNEYIGLSCSSNECFDGYIALGWNVKILWFLIG